ncbi:MAG: thioredoxin family protein [Candidatus Margulisiibacteriota bacterium]|nr:thioredoxin family protein [Candidatus Margulisiibacteriota bacterium]MBU1729593.1 thioredoxin family protein [Candidatus Margulisiibacteriota bacterium]MBU1956018.1 thioredoxin family protein [Candidatus Margulisiibacteriota bacterium]
MIKIEVVGTESEEQQDMLRNVHHAIHELKLEAEVDEITDVNEIADRFGMVVTPAIFVNGKLKCQGHIIDVEKIKECLKEVK